MKTVLLSFALLAPMLLQGGAAVAQNNSPFGFFAGVARDAATAGLVGQVRVEVVEIANLGRNHGTNDVFLAWTLHDEDPSLAGHRTGFCAMVRFPYRDERERCIEGYDAGGRWGRHQGTITMRYDKPSYGAWTTVRVKAVYHSTYVTPYSPEYGQNVRWAPFSYRLE